MFENVYNSLNLKDIIKLQAEESKFKTKCKCGAVSVLMNVDRTICYKCGYYVYRDEKTKFKYEMLKKIKGEMKK